jgi:hypothetical protein
MGRMLTINGVTFDRDRIEIRDRHGMPCSLAVFRGPKEEIALILRAFGRPRGNDGLLEGFVCSVKIGDGSYVQKDNGDWLRPDGSGKHFRDLDWAPLLDLAIEAGLILPEPSEVPP